MEDSANLRRKKTDTTLNCSDKIITKRDSRVVTNMRGFRNILVHRPYEFSVGYTFLCNDMNNFKLGLLECINFSGLKYDMKPYTVLSVLLSYYTRNK